MKFSFTHNHAYSFKSARPKCLATACIENLIRHFYFGGRFGDTNQPPNYMLIYLKMAYFCLKTSQFRKVELKHGKPCFCKTTKKKKKRKNKKKQKPYYYSKFLHTPLQEVLCHKCLANQPSKFLFETIFSLGVLKRGFLATQSNF